MSRHRHTSDGREIVAILAGNPEVVAENIGSVFLTYDKGAHAEGAQGDFVVEVNGGALPEGSEARRFRDPMAAYDYAAGVARDLFAEWVHEGGHEFPPQPIERDSTGKRYRTIGEVIGNGPIERDADLTPLTWHRPLCSLGSCDWCDARREELLARAAALAASELCPDEGATDGRTE